MDDRAGRCWLLNPSRTRRANEIEPKPGERVRETIYRTLWLRVRRHLFEAAKPESKENQENLNEIHARVLPRASRKGDLCDKIGDLVTECRLSFQF